MKLKAKHLLLFALVFAIFCYPIIDSGYYGDDSLNSLINSMMAERNFSFADQFLANFHSFLSSRLSILQLYQWVFMLFTDLIAFKIFISAMVGVALLSTYLVGKALVKDAALPYLAVIFITLIGIQFREYGDSVLAFHALTSICLILLNLSILSFIKFLDSNRRILLIVSVMLYLVACMVYEIMYPFFLIYFLIPIALGKADIKQATKYLLLFLSPVALLTLANVAGRLFVEVPQDVSDPNFHKAYQFSFDIGAIALVFVKELVASSPLSNLIFNPSGSFTIKNILLVNRSWFLFLVVLAAAFTTVFYYSLKGIKEQLATSGAVEFRRNQIAFAIFAFMLLVIPNGIIALSPKYQSEIVWGSGYTSVYFGYFGVGILLCMALYAFIKRFNATWILLAVSVVLGCVAVANFATNYRVVQITNTFWKAPRTVAEVALRRGIMEGATNQFTYMFINSNYPWDVTSFIHKYSGKFLNQERYTGGEGRFFGAKSSGNFLLASGKTVIDSKFGPKAEEALGKYLKQEINGNYFFDMGADRNIKYFDYYADSDSSGYALLADVQKIFLSNDYINGLASDRARMYVRMPEQRGVYSMMSATFLALDPITLRPVNHVTLQENQLPVISQGNGWKLVEIKTDTSQFLIDVKSIRINTSAKVYQTSLFPKLLVDKQALQFKVDSRTEVLHVGFSGPLDYSHIAFDPIKLGTEFSIIMRVRLSDNTVQAPYAHIVGNHPGKNNFEGFVFQRNPGRPENGFDFSVGNGKEWKHVFDVPLKPAKETFIALSIKDGRGKLFINDAVTSVDLGGDIRDSEMPLYIGNFIGKDRPFSGQIGELLITDTALSDGTISGFRKRNRQN